MNPFILKIAYYPIVNKILRNILRPLSKQKPLISVSGKLKVKIDNTTFQLYTNQTCAVTQELFFKGAGNYEFSRIFTRVIRKCNVFFDVGANIGYFSILSAKINPSIKTFAFEPSKGALHFLERNVTLNDLDGNIHIIGKAISDTTGTLNFHEVINPKYSWLKYHLNGSNSLQSIHGKTKTLSYPVEVITLEQVMQQHNIKQVDLIKIDTECTEHYILNSSLEIINKYRPVVICEIYDVIKDEVQQVINKLEGYLLFQIRDNTPIALVNLKQAVQGEYNFIFLPIEKHSVLEA